MARNSQRRGAGHKGKSSAVGSGGRGRKALKGRGPTPKAEDRVYHKAYKAKQERLARAAARKPAKSKGAGPEWVIGRNPVQYCTVSAMMPLGNNCGTRRVMASQRVLFKSKL